MINMCDFFLPIFASSPEPGALGNWVMILFVIVIGLNNLKTLFSKSPTHAELATKKELQDYAKDADLREFKMEVRGDMREIKAMIDGAVQKVEDYAEKSYIARKDIHRQVNAMDKGLGKAHTRIDGHEKQLTEIRSNG